MIFLIIYIWKSAWVIFVIHHQLIFLVQGRDNPLKCSQCAKQVVHLGIKGCICHFAKWQSGRYTLSYSLDEVLQTTPFRSLTVVMNTVEHVESETNIFLSFALLYPFSMYRVVCDAAYCGADDCDGYVGLTEPCPTADVREVVFTCPSGLINPLTAGAAYIRVFIFYQHIKYHILNMLKIKCDTNQQDLKRVDLHFVKSE